MEREREREMQLSALDKHIFTSKAEYTLAQINHLQGTMLNIRNLKVNRIRKGKKKIYRKGASSQHCSHQRLLKKQHVVMSIASFPCIHSLQSPCN
jgi:hypothetical protein